MNGSGTGEEAGSEGAAARGRINREARAARGARFAYLLPNFQNPTGRVLPEARRTALLAAAQANGLTLMRADGERLVAEGITSREELLRVTRD